MAWDNSTRKQRLPDDWPRRRARIMRRDKGICHRCGEPGATDVDHINAGDDHSPENLAPIHREPCHREKTQAESIAAIRRIRDNRRRPPETHPLDQKGNP